MKFRTSWADAILMDATGGAGEAAPVAGAAAAAAPDANAAAAAAAAAAPVKHDQAAADAAISAAVAARAAAAASGLYKPEGFPDHMLGKTDQETIDNAAKALKGYRERDGQVPEKPEAYKTFDKVDDAIKPYVETLTNDPLFDRLTEKAKERGIPLAHFQGLTTDLMALGAEMGIFEPPLDVAKEKALLTPSTAAHLPEAEQAKARDQRMTDNLAWLDTHVAKDGGAGLSKEAVDNLKAALGDRAYGHQAIEYFRSLTSKGNGPLIAGAAGAVADPKADIARRQALPENTWGNPKFNQASYDQLQKDGRAIFGG